jgi:hypothetical protein
MTYKANNSSDTRTQRLYVLDCENILVENTVTHCLITCSTVTAEADFPAQETAVETYLKPFNLRIRSYLNTAISRGNEITRIRIAVPQVNDRLEVIHRDWQSNRISQTVAAVGHAVETVYLEKNYLVYSGNHTVEVDLQSNIEDGATPSTTDGENNSGTPIWHRYLINTKSGEVHDLINIKTNCSLPFMKEAHKRYTPFLDTIKTELESGVYDFCAWCFGRSHSKR